jgi:hypothetical protein
LQLNREELEAAFRVWWQQSYPTAPPNSRTVETHAAFAAYVLDMNNTLTDYVHDSL